MTTKPLYVDRFQRRQPGADVTEIQVSLARLYRNVFGSHEGQKVLDDICQRICHIDSPAYQGDPHTVMEFNGRRNVGIEIAILALAPLDDSKPVVKG